MGNTPNFGFPFPDGGELIDASAVGNLANSLDEHLNDFESTTNPTMITLTMATGWTAITGGVAGDPVRLYRMGRLVVLMGEVAYTTGTAGQPIPSNRQTITTVPAGWRPATRMRFPTTRTALNETFDLYVGKDDGRMWLPDGKIHSGTPGYSLSGVWVTP